MLDRYCLGDIMPSMGFELCWSLYLTLNVYILSRLIECDLTDSNVRVPMTGEKCSLCLKSLNPSRR